MSVCVTGHSDSLVSFSRGWGGSSPPGEGGGPGELSLVQGCQGLCSSQRNRARGGDSSWLPLWCGLEDCHLLPTVFLQRV